MGRRQGRAGVAQVCPVGLLPLCLKPLQVLVLLGGQPDLANKNPGFQLRSDFRSTTVLE